MPDLGPAEILIVLLVVVLMFGGTRLADLGGSLGKGIREFRKAIREDEGGGDSGPSRSEGEHTCARCSETNPAAARFCSNCGASLE